MSDATREHELVRRAGAGDSSALEELLLDQYDRLAAQIAGKIPPRLQAALSPEDVLQEAFLEVSRRIATFTPQGDGSFFRWVATIAEHRLIDMVRAHQAAKRGGGRQQVTAAPDASQSMIDLLTMLAVHERTPSQSAAGHEAAAAIGAALVRINPDYRDALRLRYVEGLPIAQIAARLGRTEPAVHMLCHRGLHALREALGPDSRFLSRKA